MIGLDTNVLLRAATDDDPVQSPIAQRHLWTLTAEVPGHVNTVVLSEYAWTLDRRYDYARAQICASIRALLESKCYVVAERDVVSRALGRALEDGLDFPDALLCELNLAAGCTTTLTFDRTAARCAGFTPAA